MSAIICYVGLLLSLALTVSGLGIDLETIQDTDFNINEDRTLIVGATGNVPFNATQLATILGLLAAALLPLLALLCLCALALGYLFHQNSYGGGYDSYGSSYRALGLDEIDWETLSIIDWVSMGEEVFRKFEPSNLECQKKVICEMSQNAKTFGTLATNIVSGFSYLRYLELLNLPEMMKSLLSEYQDAADRGRSLRKDCREMYPDCAFSVRSMYDRFSGNEKKNPDEEPKRSAAPPPKF